VDNQLLVTLDGIRVDVAGDTVMCSIGELAPDEMFKAVVNTLSSTARYLGDDSEGRGRPTNWIHSPKNVQLRPSGANWLIARWTFEPSMGNQGATESLGARVIDALLGLGEGGDMCPDSVKDSLYQLSLVLPRNTFLWLGDTDNPNQFVIRRTDNPDAGVESNEESDRELGAADIPLERRKQAIERLIGLNVEEPPDPETLSRELEAAHEPGGLH